MPDFRPTLNLPDASGTIPMKANLPTLEPQIQAQWKSQALYHEIQKRHASDPLWVLHDGPPYTNSPIHTGTAMNKILKDTIIKSRAMMGFRTPYVPGFDNHGLPIEQAVMRAFHEKKIEPTVAELRLACREHAAKYLEIQSEQFQRLGVLGLWEKPYATMDFRFEGGIVRVFKALVEGGYVYRGLRPTLWSPSSRTALADTEIIYRDHVSKAIYVAFPLRSDPQGFLHNFPAPGQPGAPEAVIWTTTPWTIPSNQAVAFHPEFIYAIVRVGERRFIVLRDLVETVAQRCGWEDPTIEFEMQGINFDRMEFTHPLFDRVSLGVVAEYVTTEDGTGIVHTAPSHGRDDFITGQRYGLPVPNTVDERGYLTSEAGEFAGTFYKNCDTVVVDRLAEVGALLHAYDYEHSYPYAERDEKPVIFRATDQWFVSMEANDLRSRALDAIRNDVGFTPVTGEARITAMVRNRPDWCVSRQRPWGVGIPIFYTRERRIPVMDPVAIEAVAKLVDAEGSDAWFLRAPEEILPEGYTYEGESEFEKETDVLDVWFDSGSTSLNVLTGDVYPEWESRWPADLYLEGSDQHRGWFNSSLLIGMALRGEAPYRELLTHGFIVDEQGSKMSKRLGNSIDPVDVSNKLGADILRLWVATVDYKNDVPCSMAILEQVGGLYRDFRNTLRFLIGNLAGYDPSQRPKTLLPIDEWILESSEALSSDVIESYRQYDLISVVTSLHSFCRDRLSKVYLDIIKDRMYCEAADSEVRRSGQAACAELAERLILLLAPVLVYTAEESYAKLAEVLGSQAESVHLQNFDLPSDERMLEIEGSELQARFAAVIGVRERINAAFEPWKGTEGVKSKSDVLVHLVVDQAEYDDLHGFSVEELATIFGISWATIAVVEAGSEPSITFERTPYAECSRSRLRRPDVAEYSFQGETVALTSRDASVVGATPVIAG